MPKVGNKHFPYTPDGKAAARKARKRQGFGISRPGVGGPASAELKRGVFKNRYADSSRKELRSQLERQQGRVVPGGKTLAEQKAAVLGKLIARKEASERKSKPPTPGHQVKDMVPKPAQVTMDKNAPAVNAPRPFPIKTGAPASRAPRPFPDKGARPMRPGAKKRRDLRQFVNRIG